MLAAGVLPESVPEDPESLFASLSDEATALATALDIAFEQPVSANRNSAATSTMQIVFFIFNSSSSFIIYLLAQTQDSGQSFCLLKKLQRPRCFFNGFWAYINNIEIESI